MSLIKGLLNSFTNSTAYIQVWEDRVRVNIKTGVTFDGVPWIALEKNTKGIEIVKAVGNSALAFKNLSDFPHSKSIFSSSLVSCEFPFG